VNEYLKVRWLHQDSQYPVLLFSEIDRNRYELRKVEVYADGRLGFAAMGWSSGDTALGDVPVPPVSEISADPEFVVEATSPTEFENMWARSERPPPAGLGEAK
jgi:hypothetical protein